MFESLYKIASSSLDPWGFLPVPGEGCLTFDGCLTILGCPTMACMTTAAEILGGCCIVGTLGLGGAAKDCENDKHKKAEIYAPAPKNPVVLTGIVDIEEIENPLVRKIMNYQINISPRLQEENRNKCKYYPSCSEYTLQAIEKYDNKKGLVLGAYRLLRCNPLSKGGIDLLV